MLRAGFAIATLPGIACSPLGCQRAQETAPLAKAKSDAANTKAESRKTNSTNDEKAMRIHYLEIVTPDVDAICTQYTKVLGVTFGDADPNLGGARTAKLADGGLIGVRGPLRDTETPVVRPYLLVEDIEASVAAAAEAGAKVAVPPMKLPGHGTCAIVIQGEIECGFWQL